MASGPGGLFPLRISWSVSPDAVNRIFDGLGEDLRNFTPAMLRIRALLPDMFKRIFASRGAALGSSVDIGNGEVNLSDGWDVLDPAYLRRKLRGGYSPATLRLTGMLEDSLTSESGGGNAIRTISRPGEGLPRVTYGTKVPHAVAMNFGVHRRGLAPRPFIGLTDDVRARSVEILREHLDERLAAAAKALEGKGV